MTLQTFARGFVLAAFLPFAAFAADAPVVEIDLSPEQAGRVRAEAVPEAVALIPADFKFAVPGKLTVGSVPGHLPFAAYATDTKTSVGAEPDIAQLVADSLGLELNLVPIAWADWPLGLTSGRFDAVIHNVTVTEERKDKYDFATYRTDLLGFYVAENSPIQKIDSAPDVAGLKVAVGAGTNQEQILLRWIEQNKAAGLADTEILYFDDQAVLDLALQSGRLDAYLHPNAIQAFKSRTQGGTRRAGTLSGGFPETAEIAVAARKGSGIATAFAAALNAQIANGNYLLALQRWGLEAEALTESRVNPPGLPRK